MRIDFSLFAIKTARAQYLQAQDFLRQEMSAKFSERYKGRMVEKMVWGVPSLSNHRKFELVHDNL
jgi:hypothetical protein